MKLTTRYILSGILITVICLIWFKRPTLDSPVIFLLVIAQTFFIQPRVWTKEITFGIPKWNARGFFSIMTILLSLTLFMILSSRMPDGLLEELLGTWYFTGTLWLLSLCLLTTRIMEEKRKTLQNDVQLSSEAVFSDEVSS
jgi:hypothetical protein